MIQSLNYGELPKFEQFEMAFNSRYPRGVFEIRNERILDAVYPNGDVDLSLNETWLALNQCAEGWRKNHELGEIGEKILNALGFEWI